MNDASPTPLARDAPARKRYVLDVVHRKLSGWTYQEIANDLGFSRMNACHVFLRWKDWALEYEPALMAKALNKPPQPASKPPRPRRRAARNADTGAVAA